MRKLFFYIIMWIPAYAGMTQLCYAEGGFYIGLGGGYDSITNSPQNGLTFINGSGSSQNGGTFATTVFAGYNFNRIVGMELGYSVGYNGQTTTYNISQQLTDVTALVHLPFSFIADALSDFSLFARGGVGYSYYGFGNVSNNCVTCVTPPNSASTLVPVFGLGAEYRFTSL
ncbi:MAG TPA: outer membrane beta-barrel protein, partial [Aquella sp.]|nr:outer membrane beta-barrel protein [Aquella sp.]